MNKQKDNIFTAHVEKIVMVIIAILSIWILLFQVIISPNKIEFDGKKFSPDTIDSYVLKSAENLSNKLTDKPVPAQEYKAKAELYSKMYDSIFASANQSWAILFPSSVNTQNIKPKYYLPEIPELEDTYVGHIRAAAYIPKKQVDENIAYSKENSEPNDLDLVTVEAVFDLSQLLTNFEESFDSPTIKAEWKDKFYARPVIAAVELQRQELSADEEWGDWTNVPRAKTDKYRKTLESIKSPAAQEGSVKVQMLRFDNKLIRKNILQPDPYEIASSEEVWFPPSVHENFSVYVKALSVQQKVEKKEEKTSLDKDKGDVQIKRERGRREKKTDTAGSSMTPSPGGGPSPPSGGSPMVSQKPKAEKKSRAAANQDRKKDKNKEGLKSAKKELKVTLKDIEKEFDQIVLNAADDVNKYSDKITIWAYDDTVLPGKTYRYRMRIGVFNPIAGTDYYADSSESRKSDIILWSEYSEQTNEQQIPKNIYFFPIDFQESAKSVTVDVSIYKMGYWYLDTFRVHEGEIIGKIQTPRTVMKDKGKDKKAAGDETNSVVKSIKELFIPDTIGYATGIVMVDAVPMAGWDIKNLKEYIYFDLLYSYDGRQIDRIAAKQDMWPQDLSENYAEIKKAAKEPHKAFREWGSGYRKSLPSYSPTQTGTYDQDQLGVPVMSPPSLAPSPSGG